ncbi:MAG: DUF1330 domain-containing protein [Desulfuromonas sp.]|nr:MAG: DUF1330 domain-containing protein [Desulfuromonas sp.]
MAAYLIGNITIKDADLWQQYVAGVKSSLVPFEAKIVFRGDRLEVLAGNQPHDRVVVIEFRDEATLNEWFHSKDYQALIPLREQAADVVITAYRT